MTNHLKPAVFALALSAVAGIGAVLPAGAASWGWPAQLGTSETTDPALQPVPAAGVTHSYRDGSFTGPVTDAYYGNMQVKATVQGGRIVSVDVLQYPNDRRTSRAINDRALPQLQSEVIKAQTGKVHAVSGATLTSTAYMRSLNAALAQAGK